MDDSIGAPNASAALDAAVRPRLAAERLFRAVSGVWPALAIGVASRAYSIALLLFSTVLPHFHHSPLLTPFRSPLDAWDGQWYLEIALRGYHATPIQIHIHHDLAFFPGWPMLIRLVAQLHVSAAVAAFILSNGLAVLATAAVWQVFLERFGGDAAIGGTLLFAFSPAAFVLSMAYSEPLFVALAAISFLAIVARSPLRIALGAAAMLTRVSGGGLVVAAAAAAVREHGRARLTLLLAAGAGVLALLGWIAVVALISHDPLGFFHDGSSGWANWSGIAQIVHLFAYPRVSQFMRIGVMLLFVFGAVVVARRDIELGAYTLSLLGLAALPGALIESYPRYALVAFPVFAGLAMKLGRRGTIVLAVVFAILQACLVMQAFIGRWELSP